MKILHLYKFYVSLKIIGSATKEYKLIIELAIIAVEPCGCRYENHLESALLILSKTLLTSSKARKEKGIEIKCLEWWSLKIEPMVLVCWPMGKQKTEKVEIHLIDRLGRDAMGALQMITGLRNVESM